MAIWAEGRLQWSGAFMVSRLLVTSPEGGRSEVALSNCISLSFNSGSGVGDKMRNY
jgi:hypothetical protein